jgi:hypothetical protein
LLENNEDIHILQTSASSSCSWVAVKAIVEEVNVILYIHVIINMMSLQTSLPGLLQEK